MTKIYEAKYVRGVAMFLLRYLSRLDPSHADTSIPFQNIKRSTRDDGRGLTDPHIIG